VTLDEYGNRAPSGSNVATPWRPPPTQEQTIEQLRYENAQLRKWLEEAQARYRGLQEQVSVIANQTQPAPWQNLSDAVTELVRSREILRARVRELETDLERRRT